MVLIKNGFEVGFELEFMGSLYISNLVLFCFMIVVGNVVVFNGIKLLLLMIIINCKSKDVIIRVYECFYLFMVVD